MAKILTDRQRWIMQHCRYRSEFIEDEKPDLVVQMDWGYIKDTHPYHQGLKILKFLHDNGIPAIGQVDVERVEVGRLYWDDYLEIGYRTFFYFKNEPKYTKFASSKEVFACKMICPICKELCGGVADHLELTADTLPESSQFHGCIHQHRWLDVGPGKVVKYVPVDHLVVGSAKYTIDNEPLEDAPPSNRHISLDD